MFSSLTHACLIEHDMCSCTAMQESDVGPQSNADLPLQHQEANVGSQSEAPEPLSVEQQAMLKGNEAMGGNVGPGDQEGPLEQSSWHRPFHEDPVSPASSSGSALDPQLFRYAPHRNHIHIRYSYETRETVKTNKCMWITADVGASEQTSASELTKKMRYVPECLTDIRS